MFSVKTPDNTSIRFEYLSENEGRAMLKEEFYKTLPSDQLDFFKRKAYVLSNNQILYELLGNKCYYLLNNISDYLKMLRGNKYYNASIIVDNRNKELYSTFYLNPQSGYEYFQKKVKQLEKYPVLEGYHTYLMSDGSIAYLRHRVNNLYDGYWYPTLKVFEHEYYLLTSNKYSPNVKL